MSAPCNVQQHKMQQHLSIITKVQHVIHRSCWMLDHRQSHRLQRQLRASPTSSMVLLQLEVLLTPTWLLLQPLLPLLPLLLHICCC
jgi:hypothetical protein